MPEVAICWVPGKTLPQMTLLQDMKMLLQQQDLLVQPQQLLGDCEADLCPK
jgi:hypothetical protein